MIAFTSYVAALFWCKTNALGDCSFLYHFERGFQSPTVISYRFYFNQQTAKIQFAMKVYGPYAPRETTANAPRETDEKTTIERTRG